MEKFQYRACLALTGGIEGTSREWFYDELGLHSLVKRHWRNKLVFFYKTVNRLLPDYLYSYVHFPSQEGYLLRSSSASIIRPLPMRTKSFKGIYFPYYINKLNKLKVGIRNAKSINFFKKSIVSVKKENSYVLDYHLVILININLDMVLVILSILCVHAELKLKLLNISSCVINFTVLKD